MTKLITLHDNGQWVRPIAINGGEAVLQPSIYTASTNIALSPTTTLQQVDIEDLKRTAEEHKPRFSVSDYDALGITVYLTTTGTWKYLRLPKEGGYKNTAIWLMTSCVPYKDGYIQIEHLHKKCEVYKRVKMGVFGPPLGEVFSKRESVAACNSCGKISKLHSCASYDDEGEPTTPIELCSTCKEDSEYRFKNGEIWYDINISNLLHPSKNWRISYKFGGILDYYFKTTSRGTGMTCWQADKGDCHTSPFLGVELEVSGREDAFCGLHEYGKEAYRRAPKGSIALCSDSSLDGNGRSFEIISVPAKLKFLKKAMKGVYKDDMFTHGKPSKYGMHVHVDRKTLTTLMISKLTSFINVEENKAFIELLAGRRGTLYTVYDVDKSKMSKGQTRGGRREGSINLTNRTTIEFRMFATPKNYEDFCTKLEFIDALVLYVRRYAGFKDLGYSSFCNWVKREGYIYPNLSKRIKAMKYIHNPLPLSRVANVFTPSIKSIFKHIGYIFDGKDIDRHLEPVFKGISGLGKTTKHKRLLFESTIVALTNTMSSREVLKTLQNESVLQHLPSDLYFRVVNGDVNLFDLLDAWWLSKKDICKAITSDEGRI